MHPFRNFNDDFIALKDVHIWAFVRIRVNIRRFGINADWSAEFWTVIVIVTRAGIAVTIR